MQGSLFSGDNQLAQSESQRFFRVFCPGAGCAVCSLINRLAFERQRESGCSVSSTSTPLFALVRRRSAGRFCGCEREAHKPSRDRGTGGTDPLDAIGNLLNLIGAVGTSVVFIEHQPARRPVFYGRVNFYACHTSQVGGESRFLQCGSTRRDHTHETVELVIAVNETAEGVAHVRALRIPTSCPARSPRPRVAISP
jgi:hypothetical protein